MFVLTFLVFILTFVANFWQTLRGSFSAVSKPNFAIKYSFEQLSGSKRRLKALDESYKIYTFFKFSNFLRFR